MANPNFRDVFDIAITSAFTIIGGLGTWGGRRLMNLIDGKVDTTAFEQHTAAIQSRFDDIEARHKEDREDFRIELKEVNRKLDKLMDFLIKREHLR